MRITFPQQRLSYAQKKKDNWKAVKEFVNGIIRYHDQDFCEDCGGEVFNSSPTRDKYRYKRIKNMLSNYRLFNNIIDQSDFQDYCDALGIKASIDANIHEIKAYNKTYNKINVLLGEEFKRPDNSRVILTNPEGVRSKLDYKNKLYRSYIELELQRVLLEAQKAVPELSPESFESQEEYEQAIQEREQQIQQQADLVLPPEQIEKYMATSYLDKKEIMAANLLAYLYKKERIKEKKNDGFKHANIGAEEHVWVGIINGEPVVKVLNPLKMFFHKSPEIKYIQDGMYAGYRDYLTISDVLDIYADELTDDQKDKLEKTYCSPYNHDDSNLINSSMTYGDLETIETKYSSRDTDDIGSYGISQFEDVEVIHIEWVSQRKVGFLSYIDPELGIPVEKKVDESYKVPDHAKQTIVEEKNIKIKLFSWFDDALQTDVELEWLWIPEVWEATKIDEFFVNIGPKVNQHYHLYNPFKVKLGYHGLVYNNMNAPALSTMDKMKPFQFLFFIAMDKFKKLMAADKGKIIGIDSSRIDPKFPIEKTIHFLEEGGYYVYNSLQNGELPGAGQRPGLESIDGSTISYIVNFAQILAYIDQQISDAAGVTQQREGGVSPYEAVTNAQQSIIQSSHITEPLFSAHDQLWDEIKQSLIEVAQVAYKQNPLITQYILNDGSRVTLELDEDFWADNTSFGLFVSNAAHEEEVFDTLKSLVQPLIQNDRVKMQDIVNILSTDNLQELKRELVASEKQREQREEQMQQTQQQHEQQMQQMQIEAQEAERQHQINMKTMDGDIMLAKAEIDATRFKQAQDVNDNQIPDSLEVAKLEQENRLAQDDKTEAEKQRKHEAAENAKDRALEEKLAKEELEVKLKQIKAQAAAKRQSNAKS